MARKRVGPAADSGASDAMPTPRVGLAAGKGVVVVLPTYNERENLEAIGEAVLSALPEANLLVVDDSSPDGTGTLADTMAAREPRLHVLHRAAKEGWASPIATDSAGRWRERRPAPWSRWTPTSATIPAICPGCWRRS